jgi:hypothetical protein
LLGVLSVQEVVARRGATPPLSVRIYAFVEVQTLAYPLDLMESELEPLVSDEVIARLYPTVPLKRRREAAENLAQYIDLTLRVFDRIRQDPEAWARFEALTGSAQDSSVKGHLSNNSSPQTLTSSP